MHTTSLRQQHAELGSVITAMQQALKERKPGADIRALLVTLSGKLSIHLAAEDRMLYPALQAAKDPAVAEMARRFAEEMGGLAVNFKTFTHTYVSGSVIDADRDGFVKAFQGVVDAVLKRVKAEEDTLYPAADRAAAS